MPCAPADPCRCRGSSAAGSNFGGYIPLSGPEGIENTHESREQPVPERRINMRRHNSRHRHSLTHCHVARVLVVRKLNVERKAAPAGRYQEPCMPPMDGPGKGEGGREKMYAKKCLEMSRRKRRGKDRLHACNSCARGSSWAWCSCNRCVCIQQYCRSWYRKETRHHKDTPQRNTARQKASTAKRRHLSRRLNLAKPCKE